MKPTEGFFSVIQFCPNMDRGEFVNVGVVLVVPGMPFLAVRMSTDNEGPKQRFGGDAFDDGRLNVSKRGIQARIEDANQSLHTPSDLERFASLEGNNLTLSRPRKIMVGDASANLEELYRRFVHVERQKRKRQLAPDLAVLFAERLPTVQLQVNLEVEIPNMGNLKIPYAYRNGFLNLVRPEGFPHDEKSAMTKANELAVKGHLIHNHPGETPKRLIVVGAFDESFADGLKSRMEFILKEHDARLIRADRIDEFVEEVRREAHS